MLSDEFPIYSDFNMTERKEFQQEAQHNAEILRQYIILNFCHNCAYMVRLVEGLFGNQVRKGSHPRRTFLISMLG